MNISKTFQDNPDTTAFGRDSGLPCLNRDISIENPQTPQKLLPSARKTSYVLTASIEQLAAQFTLEQLGFLTLTFRDHITSPKRAQKRLNSLLSHVIKPRYHEYIGCMERQKSARIHYHLLVVLPNDIRTGAHFREFDQANYTSANDNLRSEWSYWRKTAPKYRFGRTELLPIKSNSAAIAKYVGKYIAKHMEVRADEDKGARLVRYSKGARAGTTKFQFLSDGSRDWRLKVKVFVEIIKARNPEFIINDISDLSTYLGKKWAYNNRDFILSLPV